MQNVQLTAKEAVKVYVEVETGRILGFSPEHANLLGRPRYIRYTSILLLHARDIEAWVAKYRIQQERDAEESTLRQIEREAPFRKALRDAIRERSKHVNKFNQALNETLVKLMDRRYDQIMQSKAKPVIQGMAESSEANPHAVEDWALQSQAFKNPGDQRASGSAVMREIEQIEHEKRNG